jgi:hypothetical protein
MSLLVTTSRYISGYDFLRDTASLSNGAGTLSSLDVMLRKLPSPLGRDASLPIILPILLDAKARLARTYLPPMEATSIDTAQSRLTSRN